MHEFKKSFKMFGILYVWRKASKCKKLIKKVQCRLNLLKKKRCWVVNQLRKDVSALLRNGHHQIAFQRVKQILEDERKVQTYDLLGDFCDFTISNLSYIRKHKYCSNDMNEALSTLIFSSARLGELPELLSVRKLLGEWYGPVFVRASLDLLPGNLVNKQMKELLHTKEVADHEKCKLLEELASSCVETGPLLLEYKQPSSDNQVKKSSVFQTWSNQVVTQRDGVEGKIAHIDFQYESQRVLAKERIPANGIQDFEIESFSSSSTLADTTAMLDDEEMIYLDDIEEFASSVGKDGNFQDQRLFIFKSFQSPLNERKYYINEMIKEQKLLSNDYAVSRSCRNSGKRRRKGPRRRSYSPENRNVVDASLSMQHASRHQGESWYKMLLDNQETCTVMVKNSIDLVQCRYDNVGFISNTSTSKHCVPNGNSSMKRISWQPETKDCWMQPLQDGRIDNVLESCKNSCRDKTTQPPYTPTPATLPTESPDEIDNMFRSNSFRYSSCRHIHPKLPDYDEIAAKFKALKREILQNNRKV